ncbi:MAG: SMI1/KNR4 family protein [Bacillota bacterium]|nr:SMI1/KNR4 family protein [Bacillota bacterium]
MWKDYLSSFDKVIKFAQPAIESEIENAEQELNVQFSYELKSFLLETNGIKDEFNCDILWPLERIKEDNMFFRILPEYRDIYMPFDHMLFFADSGTGDQFAYAILDSQIRNTNVFAWDHEDDSRKWVAPSIKQFIEWWLTDNIKY